jgi:hypothetical protein
MECFEYEYVSTIVEIGIPGHPLTKPSICQRLSKRTRRTDDKRTKITRRTGSVP